MARREGERSRGSGPTDTDGPARSGDAGRRFRDPAHFALSRLARARLGRHPDLRGLLAVLDDVQRRPLTMEDLCRVTHLEESTLRRKLRVATGHRPHDLVTLLSIRDVAVALRETTASIREISVLFGYRSPEALCHTFKRISGISPREYRRRHRDAAIAE